MEKETYVQEKGKWLAENFFGKNNLWQKIQPFMIVITLGIVFLWWGNSPSKPVGSKTDIFKEKDILPQNNLMMLEKAWEEKMCESLKKIEGIGDVNVNVSFASTGKQIWKHNNRQTTRNTEENEAVQKRVVSEKENQEDVVIVNSGNDEKPLLEEEQAPQIQGVVVIAQGVEIYELKWQIIEAISALTGLPPHRIIVLSMKR